MIAHGFVSGAMFLCIGVLYDRVHSREIASYGGVVNTMPKFAAFALLSWAIICTMPPATPSGLKMKKPRVTKPMWATDE